jgi:hypothetical protein
MSAIPLYSAVRLGALIPATPSENAFEPSLRQKLDKISSAGIEGLTPSTRYQARWARELYPIWRRWCPDLSILVSIHTG